MKLITFSDRDSTRIGLLTGDDVVDIRAVAPDVPSEMVAFLAAGEPADRPSAEGGKSADLGAGRDVNNNKCFAETPWHVRQPVVDGLDLSLSDEEILSQTEAAYTGTPDFQPMESWQKAFSSRLEERYGKR